ncbi:Probable RND efflux membrane fusion protein [invertebrate metagenome]|uniref:Probable RND efflux membrane fusion protein n=1 Tax=invertebrate metagenome TaxID=1711999 RepID=A0A484HA02_9ZZZZ
MKRLFTTFWSLSVCMSPVCWTPLVLLALVLVWCGGTLVPVSDQAVATPISSGKEQILVVADAVILEAAIRSLPVVGRLVSLQAGAISAETSGSIIHVAVDVGDRVTMGQVLAQLNPNGLRWRRQSEMATLTERRARATEAEAHLHIAEVELQRLGKLRQSAAFALAKYEDKAGEVKRLRAATQAAWAAVDHAFTTVRLAEGELAKADIKAPYSGVVRRRYVEVGSYIATGAHVMEVVNDCNMEIEADIAVEYLASATPGTGVVVQMTSGVDKSAIVRAVMPDEDPKTRTRLVRFVFNRLPNFELAANQSVVVHLQVGDHSKVPTVSKDAIIHRENQSVVFVIEEGRAKQRLLQLGGSVGGRFVVESGLKSGELVVVRGNERLLPGQKVQLIDKLLNKRGKSEGKSDR